METDALFELEPVRADRDATCRSCVHRERWQCGGRVIQYCGRIRSGRTFNGLKKIKVTDPACGSYEKERS